MAKSANRGGGPGTYECHGVRCTMDPPFKQGLGKGSQHDMSGPFDKGRSGGDNGLPTRVTDPMGGPKAGGKGVAAQTSSAPTSQRPRPGTKQNRY